MGKTYAYLRTSTDKQDLNHHKLEILEYARRHDLKVDEFVEIAVNNGKLKGFARVWMERIAAKQARVPNPDVIVIRVRDTPEKEALIALNLEKFFTEPHYNGFPAILVRLAVVAVDELQVLLTNAWRCQAPPALVKCFDNEAFGATELE
ncbi:hypothetical protein BH10CHL1_BH10CHL1_14940 [soil metagenome]